jgi:hypothetical protein
MNARAHKPLPDSNCTPADRGVVDLPRLLPIAPANGIAMA